MKRFLPIVLVLVLAAALRLYALGDNPPAASLDEASIGYNAYSILRTGRDEYGTKFPLLLRAYDDFRPAAYVYLVIPFVALFGVGVTAVRLPSVLLSIVDVFFVYLLVRTLLKSVRSSEYIAVVSSLLLAISPWHIVISRLGHEANLGLFFVLLGTYFFTLALSDKKKSFAFIWASLAFAGSVYGYQSQKLVVPILLFSWAILFYKRLWQAKYWIVAAACIGGVVAYPALHITLSPEGQTRFAATSDISQNNPLYRQENIQLLQSKEAHNLIGQIWYNRRFTPVKIIFANYMKHFDPVWLFKGSGNESFKAPYVGLLYPWEMPFIILGLFVLLRDKKLREAAYILLPILLTAPLAAAITTQAPHAMRAYTSIPIYQILGAMGFVWLLSTIEGKRAKQIGLLLGLGAVVWGSVSFISHYFIDLPRVTSQAYQYALHRSMQYMMAHKSEYTNVVVSNERDLSQSYMFYLFDSAYTPFRYQSSGGTVSGGFAEWHRIGSSEFRPLLWKTEKPGSTLYIGSPSDFGPDANILESFRYLDGKVGVVAATKE